MHEGMEMLTELSELFSENAEHMDDSEQSAIMDMIGALENDLGALRGMLDE
jgi:trehalose/maltose hydrolase-like predicted phosphorylase